MFFHVGRETEIYFYSGTEHVRMGTCKIMEYFWVLAPELTALGLLTCDVPPGE